MRLGDRAMQAATRRSRAPLAALALAARPSWDRRVGLSSTATQQQPPNDEPWLVPPAAGMPLPSLAPAAPTVKSDELHALTRHIADANNLLVVTGAGISTASGIPDYRSPHGSYSRGHKPIQHMEFVSKPAARQRYWARSFVGWRYFSRARPNVAHAALAALEERGLVGGGLITQNVDGLHTQAGHVDVLDLHGRIDSVECLSCGHASPRATWQAHLKAHNPLWAAAMEADEPLPGEMRADGDSEVSDVESFVVPSCPACGEGVVKPSVVFFGGSVPPSSVHAAAAAVEAADALLVVGSSLQVFSAFRIARAASQRGLPICLLNNGPTRADELDGVWKVVGDACEALPLVAGELV